MFRYCAEKVARLSPRKPARAFRIPVDTGVPVTPIKLPPFMPGEYPSDRLFSRLPYPLKASYDAPPAPPKAALHNSDGQKEPRHGPQRNRRRIRNPHGIDSICDKYFVREIDRHLRKEENVPEEDFIYRDQLLKCKIEQIVEKTKAKMNAKIERAKVHMADTRAERDAQDARIERKWQMREAREEKRKREEFRMRFEEAQRRDREEQEKERARRQAEQEAAEREELERRRREEDEAARRRKAEEAAARERKFQEERKREAEEARRRRAAQALGDRARKMVRERLAIQKALEQYEIKWAELKRFGKDLLPTGPIDGMEIPWPIFNFQRLEDLTSARIREFVFHELRGNQDKKARDVLKAEILRWHPDKFNANVVPKVKVPQREDVIAAATVVAKALTEMLSATP